MGGLAVDAMVQFHALPAAQARRRLRECCAAPQWVEEVAAGRPYRDAAALLAASDAALARLDWSQLSQALAAHPRIGQRPGGDGQDAQWSRREQAGIGSGHQPALAEANRRYEERFGHVFLIFASGRTAEQVLAQCRARLGNDEATEREVVRGELAKIVRLRLARLLGLAEPVAEVPAAEVPVAEADAQ